MSVSKRKIFYISGFDPRGARHYYELYKNEANKAEALHKAKIKISERRKKDDITQWDVKYNDETHTEYVFLGWDDIVRKHWTKGYFGLFTSACRVYAKPFFNGKFKKCLFTSWPPALSYAYPLLFLILISILSFLVALLAGGIVESYFEFNLVSSAVGIMFFLLAFFGGMKLMEKLNAFWMLRVYIFCHRMGINKTPELHERLHSYVDVIKDAVEEGDHDELLIISHSAGTIIFMSLLAKLLKKYPNLDCSKVKILTLGQSVPLLSFPAPKEDYRDDIREVAKSKIQWLDVTAPADGVCFALNSPFVGICDIENENMKVISARFHKMFEDEKYKKLKRNPYNTHLLYLRSPDKIVDYDFFQITAGKLTLEERFKYVKSEPYGYAKFKLGKRNER